MRNLPLLLDEQAFGRARHLLLSTTVGVVRRLAAGLPALAIALWLWLKQPVEVVIICVGLTAASALAGLVRFMGLAQGATWIAELPESFLRPLALVAVLYAIQVGGLPPTLSQSLSATLGVTISALVLAICLLAAFKGRRVVRSATERFRLLGGDSLTRSAFLHNAMQIVLRNADVMVVGVFCAPAEAGLYFAASRVAAIPTAMLSALDPVLSPDITRTAHAVDNRAMSRLVSRYCLVTGGSSLGVFLLFLIGGESIVTDIFGEAFRGAAGFCTVLIFGQSISNIGSPIGLSFNLSGRHLDNLRISAASAVLALILLFILTPLLGAIGAAAAFVVASALKTGLQLRAFTRPPTRGSASGW